MTPWLVWMVKHDQTSYFIKNINVENVGRWQPNNRNTR